MYCSCFQKMLLARASRWADRFSPPRTSTPPGPSKDQAGYHPLPLQLAPSSPKMGVARHRPEIVSRLVDDTNKGAALCVVPTVSASKVCILVVRDVLDFMLYRILIIPSSLLTRLPLSVTWAVSLGTL